MGGEVLVLLAGLGLLANLVLLVAVLVDLVRRPTETWASSGHNQLVWVLIVVFVAFFGPILYLVIARPALDKATVRA